MYTIYLVYLLVYCQETVYGSPSLDPTVWYYQSFTTTPNIPGIRSPLLPTLISSSSVAPEQRNVVGINIDVVSVTRHPRAVLRNHIRRANGV